MEDGEPASADPRDYDVEHYLRVLRDGFAVRMTRAFTPEDFAAVFADPDQLEMFAPDLARIRTILTPMSVAATEVEEVAAES